jgi:hypothetical protein
MSFLAPLFAIGLAALAIPILVHLVHKERKETTPFPSLMFLLRTPYQHSRRQRIRDWLLFLTRAMVFLLLVAAFARPVFDRPPDAAAAATGGGREVVILLDRSFSMRVGDRWSRAQAAARQALDGLGPADRATLVLFADQARAVREETGGRPILRAAIDSSKPGDAATRYAPALILARRTLADSDLPNREVIVVSDFQRSGWDVGEDARLAAGTTVTPVDVASPGVADRAVRAVELRRSIADGRERITVTARVSNVGPAARGIEAKLEVAGRIVATNRLDLGADAGGVVTFESLAIPETPQRAAIRITPDNVPSDDVLHFVLERAPSIPVLVVEGVTPGTDREIYLQRALEIGDRPSFDITIRRASQLSAPDIAGKRLVIINNAPWPSGELGRRLHEFVSNGGGLLVVAGDAVSSTSWPGRANGLLPVPPGDVKDRVADKGAVLGFIDRSHPALSLFGNAQSGDLSAARFYRYRAFQADSGVLARFDDGSVAVVEQRTGTGRTIVIASSFDGLWNDLPRQPVFLPFVHQLAQYASGYRAGRSVYEVGDPVDLQGVGPAVADSGGARGVAYVAVSPLGSRLRIGGTLGEPALIPTEAGIYEVRPAGSPGARPRLVAVNIPGRELDLARFDPIRLTHSVASAAEASSGDSSPREVDLAQRERKQSIWWYLLLIAATLLVVESVLAYRLSRNRVTPVS